MDDSLTVTINGRERVLDGLGSPATLDAVVKMLELRADRVAIELNGQLATRSGWSAQVVHTGDRLEVVHFVGGGC